MTQGIRLAVCIPAYGDTKAKFTLSLANALIHFLDCKLLDHEGNDLPREVDIFMVSCSMLTESRHRLVAEALAWKATHMLWLDADHVFPKDTIPRLLAHNLDVVGANYPRRVTPTAPTAVRIDPSVDESDVKNLVYTTQEKAFDNVVEEVAHMGFGVCLMNMGVLDLLQVDEEENVDGNFMPLFTFQTIPGKLGMIGEDVFFFGKIRKAGGRIFVDHALSWEVGHIHEQILTNAHANAHRGKWVEKSRDLHDRFEKAAQDAEAAVIEAQEAA
jgi:hypothetical protein